MSQIGIYLGCGTDTPRNIEEVLKAWGQHLEEYSVDTFGSVSLPKNVQEYYNHIDLPGYSCRTPLNKIFTAYRHSQQYINQHSPDMLIQLWTYSTHAPGVTLAGWLSGRPSLIRFTGDSFREYHAFSGLSKWAVYFLNNGIGRLPLRLADKVIVFGPRSANDVSSRGVNEEDIVKLPPPKPDITQFQPAIERHEYREQLGLPSDRPIALYVGRLTKQKGMEFLMKVIKQVHDRKEYIFLIAGDGPYSNQLEQEFQSSNVRLVGNVSHSRISNFYKAVDVYIHPSPYEGIPLVVLEALSCGVPVVARSAGDINLVTDNIVNSPKEMTDILSRKAWNHDWKNKVYFDSEYQSQILKNTVGKLLTQHNN